MKLDKQTAFKIFFLDIKPQALMILCDFGCLKLIAFSKPPNALLVHTAKSNILVSTYPFSENKRIKKF